MQKGGGVKDPGMWTTKLANLRACLSFVLVLETVSWYVSQAGFELLVLPPQLPNC